MPSQSARRSALAVSLKPVLRALVLGGAMLFTAPAAFYDTLPKGITQVTSVEGIT